MAKLDLIDPGSETDAQLILDLRSRKRGNFLKIGSGLISDQLAYLQDYIKRFEANEELYFKIWDKGQGAYKGVVRLTELNSDKKFNWESFVVDEHCTPMMPIDIMISTYQFGFDFFDKKVCGPWAVDRRHDQMMRIHEFVGMYNHSEHNKTDELYFWIEVGFDSYMNKIDRFKALGLGIKEINWN
jgi:hypothetical protein